VSANHLSHQRSIPAHPSLEQHGSSANPKADALQHEILVRQEDITCESLEAEVEASNSDFAKKFLLKGGGFHFRATCLHLSHRSRGNVFGIDPSA